jgi:ferric-dicitrate binding protein FerR (iron transport regulator)
MEEVALGWAADFDTTAKRGIHLSKEKLLEFEEWMAADPAHENAFVDAQQRWHGLDDFPGMREAMELARLLRQRN